jgi:hypothetical protein
LPFPELSKAVEPDTSSMFHWPTTPAAAAAGDANTTAPAATITMHQRRTSNVSPLPERERPSCAFCPIRARPAQAFGLTLGGDARRGRLALVLGTR